MEFNERTMNDRIKNSLKKIYIIIIIINCTYCLTHTLIN